MLVFFSTMLLQLVILAAVTNTILVVHQFLSKEREDISHYDALEGKVSQKFSKNSNPETSTLRLVDLPEDETTRLKAKDKLLRQEETRERNEFFQSNLRQISYYEEKIQQIEKEIQQKKQEQKIQGIDSEESRKKGKEINELELDQRVLISIVEELINNQGERRRQRERKEADSMMEKLGYTTPQSQSDSLS